MSDLDGGSAAPATPDVPTKDREVHPALACPSILDPNDYWVPAGCACVLTQSGNPLRPINVDDSACPIHSGVAGERSDSTLCGSMLNEWTCTRIADHPGPHHGRYGSWTTAPTPVPAPDPANPPAELTTGCALVSRAIVMAFQIAFSEADGSERARAGLEAVAPLIAAQALRQAAEHIRAELVCCDVYQTYPAHVGLGVEVSDVNTRGHQICYWGEAAAVLNERRADELEAGHA